VSDIHTRLFLISPVIENAETFLVQLKHALEGGRIDCLLLRFATKDEHELKNNVQMIAPIAQAAGVAVLIEANTDTRFAARSGADGVHIRYEKAALEDALEAQKPDRIVGVAGIKSRDDAMNAGELGADYLMFGEPYPDGALPDFNDVLERSSWWAEVFSTPCVAYAPSLNNITALANAHIEFIALEKAVWDAPKGAAHAVSTALAMIAASIAA
jgi:thiamine-phosphate pyrophosphorylase